jgi:hypothetical protein
LSPYWPVGFIPDLDIEPEPDSVTDLGTDSVTDLGTDSVTDLGIDLGRDSGTGSTLNLLHGFLGFVPAGRGLKSILGSLGGLGPLLARRLHHKLGPLLADRLGNRLGPRLGHGLGY